MGFLDDLRGKSSKSGVLEDERLASTDEGDHERFSHYVDKNKITESICPTCKEIHARLK